jgi:hypothetical protein
MKKIKQAGFRAAFLFFVLALMGSCASLPYLNVTYRLPPGKDTMKGRTVSIDVEDARGVSTFLGAAAQKEFQDISGSISLAVARGQGPELKIGVYEVPLLVREAFKRKLEEAGIAVVPEREAGQVELSILLKDFFLDLVDRKWQFRMSCEVRLLRNGSILSWQRVSGQAERLKLIGREQADQVVGEVFTDTMNQLDVGRLFQQANL